MEGEWRLLSDKEFMRRYNACERRMNRGDVRAWDDLKNVILYDQDQGALPISSIPYTWRHYYEAVGAGKA